ncbi:MAG: PaaI family thioesterase [Actinomycetota bacterium]
MDEQQRLAEAVQRLGDLIITRSLDDAEAGELADRIEDLGSIFDGTTPASKIDRFGGRNRVHEYLDTGVWPEPPPDGSEMDFDIGSCVGGEYNPFGMGTRYFRDGDESIARVSVPRCFEGPPGRVHGGILAAIFDEVMGTVFRATGTSSAFTGELTVRFEGPAPIATELEFRAREVRTEGRKRFLEAEATGPDGRFASASAIFINMKPEHLDRQVL